MLGLGVVALAAHYESRYDPVIMMTFAVSSALLAAIMLLTQFSPVAARGRWVVMLISLIWAAGFWLASDVGDSSSAAAALHNGVASRLLLNSFALWTGVTGLLWLLSPGPLSGMTQEKLGPGGAYFATARGAVDLPMALLAWTVRSDVGHPPGIQLAVVLGIFVQNTVLSVIGFVAQLGSIHSPARWAVELLHVYWMVGAAVMLKF